MKTAVIRFGMFAGVAALSIGCGKDWAGTYKGTESGTQAGTAFSQDVTFTVSEGDNDAVAATYTTSSGNSGTASGTTDGDEIKSLAVVDAGCAGTLAGSLKEGDNDSLSGTVSGTTTNCGAVSATLSLKKQD